MPVSPTLRVEAVLRHSLPEEIAQQLEWLILQREVQVGDALPSERRLADQFGVSRNALREAISILAHRGLLEVRQGSGTFIVSPKAEFLRDWLDVFIRLSSAGLFDLIESRRILEVAIAELAAQRATEEDCEHLRSCLSIMEDSAGNPGLYVDADIEFHSTIAKAAKNRILAVLIDSMRGALRESISILVSNHPTAAHEAMSYHRRIVKAIEQRSPEEARLSMKQHLEVIQRNLEELTVSGAELLQDQSE